MEINGILIRILIWKIILKREIMKKDIEKMEYLVMINIQFFI